MRLIFFVCLIISTQVHGQSSYSSCQRATKLIYLLNRYHIEPKELDDSLSHDLFQNFFQKLDPQALYFTQADIDKYNHLKYQLDDVIRSSDCRSIDSITTFFEQRLLATKNELLELKVLGISLNNKDSIQVSSNMRVKLTKNGQELKEKWIRWIKYLTLNEYFSRDSSETNGVSEMSYIFERLCDRQIQNVERILNKKNGVKGYVDYRFLNAISTSFDPHTMYFSHSDIKLFLESNSSDLPSFGIDLEEDINGNVKIARLIPGGSAWRTNELNEGDVLLTVRTRDEPEYDLLYHNTREVWEIFERVGSEMELSVRKVGGQIISVRLNKEILRADENVIKSLILTKRNDFKVGYISLPGFYSADNAIQTGCSADLAKEILKLRKEGIKGMILDIRDNGGGDMHEAIQLAGIFIDKGSLGIYKERREQAKTLKDPNIGTIYDGPLLVMVNGGSASASELLAGTLQDHNRALIAGSHTFGKASGQRIVPLYNKLANSDFLKVTELKLYRPTGRSYQLSGIQPDIRLPQFLRMFYHDEGSLPFALPPDHSAKKAYYYPLERMDIDTLVSLSNERVHKNPYFQRMAEVNNHFLHYKSDQLLTIPLSYDSFKDFISVGESDAHDNLSNEVPQIEISFNSYDDEVIDIDEYARDVLNDLKDSILEDRYVDECYNIIIDYISLAAK